MDKKEFAKEMEKRTKMFALAVMKLVALLPCISAGSVIGKQVIRSGTSIGANYREANRSVSSADFKNKISICEKESSETQYWLEIIQEAELITKNNTDGVYCECTELLKIFTSIGKNMRRKL